MIYDAAIVGGGILGLATAFQLLHERPTTRLLLMEKEANWAAHQTGHNSGVIHSGIYYKPGSAKARLAVSGARTMVAFCQEHQLPFEICGKVIVATNDEEISRLNTLAERAEANGVPAHRLSPEQLLEHEPHCEGRAALHIPSTGIIDYRAVTEKLASLALERGASLHRQTHLQHITPRSKNLLLHTSQGEFETRFLINTAGLYSDRVARLGGAEPGAKIVPFRGEYYELVPEKRGLVNNLIYPVPNPKFPFLGVHFTRMIDGTVHAGPNAVLALAREGYRKTDINLEELAETLTYPAFWKLARRHADEGLQEILRSLSKRRFVQSMQTLIPAITETDVVPAGAGVRAQALSDNGTLVDDFLLIHKERQLHVCNAPSPAATASLEIAREIVRLHFLTAFG